MHTLTDSNRGSIPLDATGEPKVTNEMKAECIGEFTFTREATCTACHYDEPQDDCEVCGGEVQYIETITVPWTSCKEIYKAMANAARRVR